MKSNNVQQAKSFFCCVHEQVGEKPNKKWPEAEEQTLKKGCVLCSAIVKDPD